MQKTVEDIVNKARGDYEVVVILDENDQPIKHHKNVRVYKKEGIPGLRSAINQAVKLSKGKYIMKLDAHCMMDEGFDLKLAKYCDDNWVVIPRRYSLLPETWEETLTGRLLITSL